MPASRVQAFAVGPTAYGVRYHVEQTSATVSERGSVPAYGEALEATLRPGSLARLKADTAQPLPAFDRDARRLYDSVMRLVGGSAA